MIKEITHIGITVKDIDKSIEFYRDTLGLKYMGSVTMKGEATDKLFNGKDIIAKVAYLNGSDEIIAPPIELIQFVNQDSEIDTPSLTKVSISEICFRVNDIDKVYKELKSKGVHFLSEPQLFDFTKEGFSKSKAVYFKDIDGITLELMQYL